MSPRMNGKDYGQSILGWYGQPCHEQWNGKDCGQSIYGWYGQPFRREWDDKDYWHYIRWACAVDTINNTDGKD